jgi:RNA polymerase sigma-54 factor
MSIASMTAVATQRQQQGQTSCVTARQIMAQTIIALPRMALTEFIQEKVTANPCLCLASNREGLPEDQIEQLDDLLGEPPPTDDSYDVYQGLVPPSRLTRKRIGAECGTTERVASRPEPWKDLLLQLRNHLSKHPNVLRAAEVIVGNLDHDGFLRESLEELALADQIAPSDAVRALDAIQSCDPPGIGARDLREALLLQLRRLGLAASLSYDLVEQHLADLGKFGTDVVAQRLGVPHHDIDQAAKIIRSLSRRPADRLSDDTRFKWEAISMEEQARRVDPDIFLRNGAVSVDEADPPLPQLNPIFKKMLKDAKRRQDKETMDWLIPKFREARQLQRDIVDGLRLRGTSTRKIAEALVRRQHEFLVGVGKLRPLTMSEVAREVGLHESTVSRVVALRYMQTERAVVALRALFVSGGVNANDGAMLGPEILCEMIKTVIEAEDPPKPLSDPQIATNLLGKGLRIARRTVTKYREASGLVSAGIRKERWRAAQARSSGGTAVAATRLIG